MVQLPATAAIEYVAAGHFFPGVLAGGDFWPGGFLSGDAFVRGSFAPGDFCPGAYTRSPPSKFNAYTHRLGFLCLTS